MHFAHHHTRPSTQRAVICEARAIGAARDHLTRQSSKIRLLQTRPVARGTGQADRGSAASRSVAQTPTEQRLQRPASLAEQKAIGAGEVRRPERAWVDHVSLEPVRGMPWWSNCSKQIDKAPCSRGRDQDRSPQGANALRDDGWGLARVGENGQHEPVLRQTRRLFDGHEL